MVGIVGGTYRYAIKKMPLKQVLNKFFSEARQIGIPSVFLGGMAGLDYATFPDRERAKIRPYVEKLEEQNQDLRRILYTQKIEAERTAPPAEKSACPCAQK